MTQYTVAYGGTTQADLALIWLNSLDRSAVTRASNAIDAQLKFDASQKGQLVSEGLRQLEVTPLIVQFTVDEGGRIVTVWTIREQH